MNENNSEVSITNGTITLAEKTKEEVLMQDALALIDSTHLRFDDNTITILEVKDGETVISKTVEISKEFADNYKKFRLLYDRMDSEYEVFKNHLTSFLETNNMKDKYESNGLKFQYTSAFTRANIDSDSLKKDLPSIANRYVKVSSVKASSKLSVIEEPKYEW